MADPGFRALQDPDPDPGSKPEPDPDPEPASSAQQDPDPEPSCSSIQKQSLQEVRQLGLGGQQVEHTFHAAA